MAGISDAAATLFYDAVTGKATWTATNMFASPTTNTPSDDNGSGLTYATGFTDDDLELPNANWAAPSLGAGAYNALIDYGAHSGAVTITGIAWHTADAKGGTFLGWEPLAANAVLANGNSFQIDSGTMTCNMNANSGQGTLSNAACDLAYNAITGKSNFTAADRYLALMTAEFSNYETPTGGTEVSTAGTAYARQLLANATWDAAAGTGAGSYGADVVYPTATANWGDVQGVAIITHVSDAISTTNFYGYVDLSNLPQTVNNGGDFKILTDTLTLDCAAG